MQLLLGYQGIPMIVPSLHTGLLLYTWLVSIYNWVSAVMMQRAGIWCMLVLLRAAPEHQEKPGFAADATLAAATSGTMISVAQAEWQWNGTDKPHVPSISNNKLPAKLSTCQFQCQFHMLEES